MTKQEKITPVLLVILSIYTLFQSLFHLNNSYDVKTACLNGGGVYNESALETSSKITYKSCTYTK